MKRGCICSIVDLQRTYRGPLGFNDWLFNIRYNKEAYKFTGSGPILLYQTPQTLRVQFIVPIITRNLSS